MARCAWLLLAATTALPGAAGAQDGAGPADPVASLAEELREGDPTEVGDRARSDPRILALDARDRERLLASLEEGTVWWAPLLNLYPGLGLGSLASRDPRGAWLTLADGAAVLTVMVGLSMALADPGPGASLQDLRDLEASRRTGRHVAVGGLVLLGASRVAGVILPFTFRGRRHRELERVLAELPPRPRLEAFVAPIPLGRGAGAAAGLAVAF